MLPNSVSAEITENARDPRVRVVVDALSMAHQIDTLRKNGGHKTEVNEACGRLLNLMVLVDGYRASDSSRKEFYEASYLTIRDKVVDVAFELILKTLTPIEQECEDVLMRHKPYPVAFAARVSQKMSQIETLIAALGGYTVLRPDLTMKIKKGWERVIALAVLDQNFGAATNQEEFIRKHNALGSLRKVAAAMKNHFAAHTQAHAIKRLQNINVNN